MDVQEYLKEGVDSWNSFMLLYNSALKEMNTKIEILNDEFQHIHQYNPIEYVKKRIKKPESIVKKLKRYGYESTIENMVKYVNDVAGIRIVCSFTSDIYRLAEMIKNQNDITVLSEKDYIKNPKPSGYKSYHMIVTVPIFLSDRVVDTKVEVQIRTLAMDFWASLEHKIYYKFEGNAPEYISRDLRECSNIVSMLDAKMLSLNEAILEAKKEQGDPVPEAWEPSEQSPVEEDEVTLLQEFDQAEPTHDAGGPGHDAGKNPSHDDTGKNAVHCDSRQNLVDGTSGKTAAARAGRTETAQAPRAVHAAFQKNPHIRAREKRA